MDSYNYNRLDFESDFEYKLRLCKAKKNHEIDLSWEEIVKLLKLDISADYLSRIAVGLLEYDNYINKIDYSSSILSISDLHIPFQLDKEELFLYKNKIDILQLNGDVCDMQAISKFPKVYRISPMEEIIKSWEYLSELIRYLKPKKVIVNYGNHDLRFQNYLARNLDSDLLELMPKTSLELILLDGFKHFDKQKGMKIEYIPLCKLFNDIDIIYTDKWYSQIGDTIFCHPSAYSSGILKTAEKAMLWFRNEGFIFNNLVMAHTHRSGQYTIGNTTIYEQGAFCDVSQSTYTESKLINSKKEGYIVIYQDSKGNTIKDKTELKLIK